MSITDLNSRRPRTEEIDDAHAAAALREVRACLAGPHPEIGVPDDHVFVPDQPFRELVQYVIDTAGAVGMAALCGDGIAPEGMTAVPIGMPEQVVAMAEALAHGNAWQPIATLPRNDQPVLVAAETTGLELEQAYHVVPQWWAPLDIYRAIRRIPAAASDAEGDTARSAAGVRAVL